MTTSKFPLYISSHVIPGYKRGSKLLGVPTANLSISDDIQDKIRDWNGVYVGWAKVYAPQSNNSTQSEHYNRVFKSVLSIGENPHFNGKQKTIEPHILHQFPEDFYGKHMKLIVCGFLRDQEKFDSLEALITAIQNDLKVGADLLDETEMRKFETDPFFDDEDKSES